MLLHFLIAITRVTIRVAGPKDQNQILHCLNMWKVAKWTSNSVLLELNLSVKYVTHNFLEIFFYLFRRIELAHISVDIFFVTFIHFWRFCKLKFSEAANKINNELAQWLPLTKLTEEERKLTFCWLISNLRQHALD